MTVELRPAWSRAGWGAIITAVLAVAGAFVAVVDPFLCWEFALVVVAGAIARRAAVYVWAAWAATLLLDAAVSPAGITTDVVVEVVSVAAVSAAVCALVRSTSRPMTRLRQAWVVLGVLLVLSVAHTAVMVATRGAPEDAGEVPRSIVGVFAMLSLGAAISWWQEGGRPRPALCAPLALLSLTAFVMLGTAQVLRYRDIDALNADAERIGAAFLFEHSDDLRVMTAEAEAAESDPLDVDNLADRMRPVLAGHEAITAVALVEIDPDGVTNVLSVFDDADGTRGAALADWLATEHDNSGEHHSQPGVADYIDYVTLPDDDGDASVHLAHASTIRTVDGLTGDRVLYVAMSVPALLRAASTPTLSGSGGADVALWRGDDAQPQRVAFVNAVDDRGVLVEVPTDDPELVGAASFELHSSSFEVLVRPSVGYGLAHSSLRLILLSLAFVGLVGYLTLAQRRINVAAVDEVRRRRQALLDAALAGSRGWSAVVDTSEHVRISNEHPLGTSEGHRVADAGAVAGDPLAMERVRQLLADARVDGVAATTHVGADEHGRTRIVEMSANVLPATGEERLCFVQFVDVTAERERLMRAAQADRMEAIGALAGGVAHDFNNLLFITLGYLQLMEQHADRVNDPKLASYVAPAIDAVRRGAEVTKALLTVSGQHPMNQRGIDLAAFVTELAPLVTQAVGKRVEVRYHLEPGVAARVDPGRLSGCLLNLCANSRHAVDGRPDPAVDITVRRTTSEGVEQVVIEVADNGVGMPAEVAARAFEPFFTTKGRGKGTGLGLASVFSFAQQSGGSATIDSAEGVGTTVTIRVPAALPLELTGGDVPASVRLDRALVVDDEKDIADLVASWLEPFVGEVKVAQTPWAALELADAFAPQLLICDAHLESSIDGLEVARRVLAQRPDTVVVFMTGYAERVRELESTGAATLAKPFSRDDFLTQMRECGALPVVASDVR